VHISRRFPGWDIDERGDLDPVSGWSGWVTLRNPSDGIALAFETDDSNQPPVWPARSGQQSMMMHLEIAVDDVQSSVDHALAAGATSAPWQPPTRNPRALRVLLDPAGHPFCLFHDAALDVRPGCPLVRGRRLQRSITKRYDSLLSVLTTAWIGETF